MAKRKTMLSSEERFDVYYKKDYGERWEELKKSLLGDSNPIAFEEGLLTPYYMDEASIVCSKLLEVEKGDTVLDMCAAPGGKTLVLASALQGTGSLVSNDRSSGRRARLHRVIETHLKESWRNNIRISAHDASKWGLYEQNIYDKVLLDAPCSSERHVIKDQQYLDQWTPNRPKRLSTQQFAMLAAALEAVKVGGTIVYSTCAIAKAEDELVIEKLWKKREGRFKLVPFTAEGSEACKYGRIILPDASKGRGPMYFCKLQKIQ